MSDKDYIHFSYDGPIGIITFHNPPENFLLTPDFIGTDDLKSFVGSKNMKGLILTGAGRHFSAGAELDKLYAYARDEDMLKTKIERGNNLLRSIEELEIPVISAIEGVCFGGGLEIALACHIRISSEKALFAFPEINQNLMPGLGGIQRITNLLKGGLSYEMILSGDMMNAEKALELNIIDHLVSKGKALDHSIELIKSLVQNRSLEVIRAITKTINFCRNRHIDDTLHEVTTIFCELAVSEAKRRKEDKSE